jgi:hypothetical protein
VTMIISTKDHDNSTTVATAAATAASMSMLNSHVAAALGHDRGRCLGKVRHGLQSHNTKELTW